MPAPLFLIGFMAAGKTSVGRALALATSRRFVDLDDVIAADTGETSAILVARDEPSFRRLEAATLERVIAGASDGPIVSTGGGVGAREDSMFWMRQAGLVVALGVDVAEAERRAAGGPPRPLLATAATLAAKRAPAYRRAHVVVDTTGKSIAEVVAAVQAVERVWHRLPADHQRAALVALGDRSYPVTIDDAPLDGELVRGVLGTPSNLAVITDRNVARSWLAPTLTALPGAQVITIEPGEASKSIAVYEQLCNELVAQGLDRGSAIVALGGGVVGDLAGFAAATLFRGIPIVQLPTTIVAMTDSAIGGKTAVDLPAGKNLVGAFWQPRLVACCLPLLRTLPGRERRAGFGELWKYALLDGRELWDAVRVCAAWAAGPEGTPPPPAMRDVIERSIAYKAAIVGRDERELTGHRALLNLGHTIGHAIETAAGGALLHGEAVGLGLVAACRISAAAFGARPELEHEVSEALAATGLPIDLDRWLTDDVLARIQVDKKRIGTKLRFIVAREVGACDPVEIPVTDVQRILRSVPLA